MSGPLHMAWSHRQLPAGYREHSEAVMSGFLHPCPWADVCPVLIQCGLCLSWLWLHSCGVPFPTCLYEWGRVCLTAAQAGGRVSRVGATQGHQHLRTQAGFLSPPFRGDSSVGTDTLSGHCPLSRYGQGRRSHPRPAQSPRKLLFILPTGVQASCHVLGSCLLGVHPAVVASPW